MNATLTAPNDLDAMLAEIDGAASSKAKYDSKHPPEDFFPHLNAAARRLPIATKEANDLEAELSGIKADFIAAAAPFQLAKSRQFGVHVTTVKLNGVACQCRPPHYTTCIKDKARIHELAALYGPRFPSSFKVVYVVPDTKEAVAALKATGVPYEVQIAPTKELHEHRFEPTVYELLAQTPEVRPIWAMVCGKDA